MKKCCIFWPNCKCKLSLDKQQQRDEGYLNELKCRLGEAIDNNRQMITTILDIIDSKEEWESSALIKAILPSKPKK